MDIIVPIGIINNAALLLVLSSVSQIIYFLPKRYDKFKPFISGFLISIVCLIVMTFPFTVRPGLFYDTRSILISVSALIFGYIPTLIVATIAIVYRIYIGGIGTLPGITVILSSALIGLAWHRWLYPEKPKLRWLNIYVMSILVHLALLASTLLVPTSQNINVIREIGFSVMIVYPVASVLLGLFLIRQKGYRDVQDQLQETKGQFQSLFYEAPLSYQSLDTTGNFIEVNKKWLDTFGYSRNEVIGKWFGDFLPYDSRELFRRSFYAFKAQGIIHNEFEILHKSGKHLFVSFEGKTDHNPDGSFRQMHCILQDITEQRKAEETLTESEKKYRNLFETIAQGIIYQSADGKIISVNPAAEKILGLTFDKMQGRTAMDPMWDTVKADGTPLPYPEFPSTIALRTGKFIGPVILGINHPENNERLWLSITATPLFKPGAMEPYQVYVTMTDITAEKNANLNYQLLFDKMIDAFALHEIITDENGKPVDYRFLAVNPAFEKMTGLKKDDIIGKTVREVLPEIESYWIDTYGNVALTGEPVEMENYSANLKKYFHVSAYRPAPKQFAVAFIDITSRHL
ncbi:MAG: PAS domain S-box protein [Saccharofermentanales bacterium]